MRAAAAAAVATDGGTGGGAGAAAELAVWAGEAGGEPWDPGWGRADLLVGDGFYEQLKSLPIWRAQILVFLFLSF